MTQEPKMDPTLTLGTIVTSFSVGIVTGMVIMVALDAMGQRNREVDKARSLFLEQPTESEHLDDEALAYELSESMGRDLPPAA